MHFCYNCEAEFKGNYCPNCGQKADTKRITWASVWENVMNVWGMGDRSMLKTILQLLKRPGYFIGDYLNGKRRSSFPPVRMLLIIVVIITILENLLHIEDGIAPVVQDDTQMLADVTDWFSKNPGIGALVANCMFILPTWFAFRFSPRHTRHTLPEGFFVQMFLGSLVTLVAFLGELISSWIYVVSMVYYVVAYHQLFGYRVWGTVWRLCLCFMASVFHLLAFIYAIRFVIGQLSLEKGSEPFFEVVGVLICSVITFMLLGIAMLISYLRRNHKKTEPQKLATL